VNPRRRLGKGGFGFPIFYLLSFIYLLSFPSNLTALGIRHDMPTLHTAADLMLSTSIFGEGFPNVVAEAMACGVPVVATDVGDSRHIVGDTGVIVSPCDIAGMASAITRIMAEPETKHGARASAARGRIEDRYSLERMVRTFDALHLRGTLPVPDDGDDDNTAALRH
jgi:glycosyltransferase involved in cell wall biosynthesis